MDNYEEDSRSQASGRFETSSDGEGSYFSRMFTKQGKNEKVQMKTRGTFVGTPLYCAPEMLETNQSGFFSDLWALGVIIYEMSCGYKMFTGKNNKEIFDKIIKQEVFFPYCID